MFCICVSNTGSYYTLLWQTHIRRSVQIIRPICASIRGQWRTQRGQIRPWPPIEVGNGVWPPLGEKSNDSIVNLWKCNDYGALGWLSMSATDLCPLRKNRILKHEKIDD